jgi:pyruvate/2-oxoglutarate dehydrogenase complex dihydrolipoamide dehydrogenase (E3) component
MQRAFEREGIRFAWGRTLSARREGDGCLVATGDLWIASGRKPAVEGLDLYKAGVKHSQKGIPVDDGLRTNVKHIYAAGDVVGGHQFTHFAGWQAFQAVRNALLPGSSSGFSDVVPWVTFTDPEVAHVGLTESQARSKSGNAVQVRRWDMSRADRAVCENDTDGVIKVIVKKDGAILGATIVAARAGEAITNSLLR